MKMPVCGLHISKCGAAGRAHMRSAFSFTEVLFAVIILGIGFIMVASIFPVAIQQAKQTSEETTGAAVARGALSYLGEIAANGDAQNPPLFPATGLGTVSVSSGAFSSTTGRVFAINGAVAPVPEVGTATLSSGTKIWDTLKGSLVLPSDPRFAFVALYRRDGDPADSKTWAPFAQVWFIPVTPRVRSTFALSTKGPNTDVLGTSPDLQAKLAQVAIQETPAKSGTWVVYVNTGASIPTAAIPQQNTPAANYTPSAVSSGTYLVIADDHYAAPSGATPLYNGNYGRLNGRIYRVGAPRPELNSGSFVAFDLAAGNEITSIAAAGNTGVIDPGADGYVSTTPPPNDDISGIGTTANPADAWVVGLDATSGTFTGTSQDIAAYTTFIKVN